MNKDEYLKVEGLSKNYGDLAAVKNIFFYVKKGEIFGLLGPNGAGKTTTIKMICGLVKPDSGHIVIGDLPLASAYRKAKTMIGLCPQEIVIWGLLTVMEQLDFCGMSYGLTKKEAQERGESVLTDLGLSDQKDRLGKNLSGGMQRRLNIALALIHDPSVIILDEPQAGLDPQSKVLVRDLIRRMAQDKAVILTTHDMDEADRLSDRLSIIDHGEILLTGTPQEIKESSGMSDVLEIAVEEISDETTASIFAALPPEISGKKHINGSILLEAHSVLPYIPFINSLLAENGISSKGMTVRQHTLEDAFIKMTGRGLRQ